MVSENCLLTIRHPRSELPISMIDHWTKKSRPFRWPTTRLNETYQNILHRHYHEESSFRVDYVLRVTRSNLGLCQQLLPPMMPGPESWGQLTRKKRELREAKESRDKLKDIQRIVKMKVDEDNAVEMLRKEELEKSTIVQDGDTETKSASDGVQMAE